MNYGKIRRIIGVVALLVGILAYYLLATDPGYVAEQSVSIIDIVALFFVGMWIFVKVICICLNVVMVLVNLVLIK